MNSWNPPDGTILGKTLEGEYVTYRDGRTSISTKGEIEQARKHTHSYGPRSVTELKLFGEMRKRDS